MSGPSPEIHVPLANEHATHVCNCVQAQIHGISQLPPHSTVLQHRIHTLAIGRNSSSLKVLDILSNPQGFSCEAEVLFDSFVGCDQPGGVVCSEEIPRVEAREVLEGAEELVTTNYSLQSGLSSKGMRGHSVGGCS